MCQQTDRLHMARIALLHNHTSGTRIHFAKKNMDPIFLAKGNMSAFLYGHGNISRNWKLLHPFGSGILQVFAHAREMRFLLEEIARSGQISIQR